MIDVVLYADHASALDLSALEVTRAMQSAGYPVRSVVVIDADTALTGTFRDGDMMERPANAGQMRS